MNGVVLRTTSDSSHEYEKAMTIPARHEAHSFTAGHGDGHHASLTLLASRNVEHVQVHKHTNVYQYMHRNTSVQQWGQTQTHTANHVPVTSAQLFMIMRPSLGPVVA
jgi:hypothetical protein